MFQPIKAITVVSVAFIITGCNSSDTSATADSRTLRIHKETFANANGTTDEASYQYATDGTLLKRDLQRDGVLIMRDTYSFDEAGQLQRLSYDSNADGEIDYYDEFEYDDQGRVAKVYEYNRTDEITAYKQFTFDNGLAIKRETRTVDNITTTDQLDGTTGTLQRTLVYRYENNRLISFTIDFDSDAIIDGNMAHAYNPDGTISTIVHSTVDQVVDTDHRI